MWYMILVNMDMISTKSTINEINKIAHQFIINGSVSELVVVYVSPWII